MEPSRYAAHWRPLLVLSALALAGATVAAVSGACTASVQIDQPSLPSSAVSFSIPDTGWEAGATCTDGNYLLYPVPGCKQLGYILCYNGFWEDSYCGSAPPAGFVNVNADAGSDGGASEGGEAGSGGDAASGGDAPSGGDSAIDSGKDAHSAAG